MLYKNNENWTKTHGKSIKSALKFETLSSPWDFRFNHHDQMVSKYSFNFNTHRVLSISKIKASY